MVEQRSVKSTRVSQMTGGYAAATSNPFVILVLVPTVIVAKSVTLEFFPTVQ